MSKLNKNLKQKIIDAIYESRIDYIHDCIGSIASEGISGSSVSTSMRCPLPFTTKGIPPCL